MRKSPCLTHIGVCGQGCPLLGQRRESMIREMAMRSKVTWIAFSAAGGIALAITAAHAADKWYPFKVEVWDPPFNMESPRKVVEYAPLEKADKKWDICVSFPHMKDAYWMAVDYGVVAESQDLGVKMNLVEAGGYTN